MGPKKRSSTESHIHSTKTKKIKVFRHSQQSSDKRERVRRALNDINANDITIRKGAKKYGLSYSFLYRRVTGEVHIDSRNGRATVFSKDEEEAMATWINEMADRGMELKASDFLDFVQDFVSKEKRVTPFTDCRPSYDWYHAFLTRNSHIIQSREKNTLGTCRGKLNKKQMDYWFKNYKAFVISKGLIDKPSRIFHADGSVFYMGRQSDKETEAAGHIYQLPSVLVGQSKETFTAMFSGCADGSMLPPFFVFPAPRQQGYDPLSGGVDNSGMVNNTTGCMDPAAFQEFLQHFDRNCGEERPVILIIDNTSSHVSMDALQYAKSKGIELYGLVRKATDILKPLDKAVFWPLKSAWSKVLRRHSRDNPGMAVGKENFAQLLKEAFLLFYEPLTVINSFLGTGLYPVDSTVITSTLPDLPFTEEYTFGSTQSLFLKDTFTEEVDHEEHKEETEERGKLEISSSLVSNKGSSRTSDKTCKINFNCPYFCYFFTKSYV